MVFVRLLYWFRLRSGGPLVVHKKLIILEIAKVILLLWLLFRLRLISESLVRHIRLIEKLVLELLPLLKILDRILLKLLLLLLEGLRTGELMSYAII